MSFSDRAKDLLGRVIHSEISTVEASGLANSVASIAVSFDSGLLPRTLPQQGVLTGLWGVSTYAMTATVQSFVEASVRRVSRNRISSTEMRRGAILAADAAVIGAGLALQKAFPKLADEPLARAAARSLGWRLTLSGASGVTAITVDTVHDTVTKEHDENTVSTVMTVVAGSAVAGGMYLWRSRTLIDTGVERDQYGQDVVGSVRRLPWVAAGIGPAVTLALLGISRAERWAARTVGQGICFVAPSTAPYATAIGHALTLGAITVGAGRGISFVYHTTETAGDAIEAAYSQVPDSPYVSGSPSASGEDWTTFGREGRRYVNMAMTAQEVSAVIGGEAIDPIRAYVGLGTDVSPNRRAARAMSELDRLGAFERDYIAIFFPTGTGYVNYVALEALEYFTAGNVASVTIQYSVRPSFLSLGEVGTARESNLLLLNRLSERLRGMPRDRRPKVLLFGESLGSLGGQDVLVPEGTDDLDVLAIDGALFIGTPYASKWRQRWLADPVKVDPDGIVVEVQGIEEWNALPAAQRERARIVLLTHNNDPIPKFGAPLIIQEPDWLGPADQRPPGVPRHTVFIPGLTFLTTAIDLLNSEHVKPGVFEAFGHDYRFDLAEMVRAAYHLDVPDATVAAVEAALRQREVVWAERRLITETLAHAEGKIRKAVSGWGIDSGSVPNIVEPQRDVLTDPYAVAEPEASVES